MTRFMDTWATFRSSSRNLAACRKGQFEGMPEKLLQPEWAPDYGERKIHPTAGITAIGARMPLIPYNINLARISASFISTCIWLPPYSIPIRWYSITCFRASKPSSFR